MSKPPPLHLHQEGGQGQCSKVVGVHGMEVLDVSRLFFILIASLDYHENINFEKMPDFPMQVVFFS